MSLPSVISLSMSLPSVISLSMSLPSVISLSIDYPVHRLPCPYITLFNDHIVRTPSCVQMLMFTHSILTKQMFVNVGVQLFWNIFKKPRDALRVMDYQDCQTALLKMLTSAQLSLFWAAATSIIFIMTKVFFATNMCLSRQNTSFVATKMILVAALANDR